MSEGRVFSIRNPWFAASVSITAAVAIVAAVAGFVWFPMQADARYAGIWDAICSAAGLVRPAAPQPVEQAGHQTSRVVVVPQMLHDATAESIGRGATFALRCTMCHGARGLSDANSPNLAGQYPAVIYKQLLDFKSGARTSAVMGPTVADLGEPAMRDLAAYYAYLPRLPAYHPAGIEPPPAIVVNGAPMRNIPPCGSCHGGLANKTGSAWLEGQPVAYLQAQLQAFVSGARRNDISGQMRNVARRMTPAEITAAAQYYASQPNEAAVRTNLVQ